MKPTIAIRSVRSRGSAKALGFHTVCFNKVGIRLGNTDSASVDSNDSGKRHDISVSPSSGKIQVSTCEEEYRPGRNMGGARRRTVN